MDKSCAVFCNGAVHWYSKEHTSPYFVVDDETLKTMPMPMPIPPMPLAQRPWYINHFGESCGHLHMIVSNHEYYSLLQFNFWEMASDYSGWSVRYHVDLCSVRTAQPKQSWISVVSIIWTQKEEESIIILIHGGRAISYNPCDGTASKLCDLDPRPKFYIDYKDCDAYRYFETLACV